MIKFTKKEWNLYMSAFEAQKQREKGRKRKYPANDTADFDPDGIGTKSTRENR